MPGQKPGAILRLRGLGRGLEVVNLLVFNGGFHHLEHCWRKISCTDSVIFFGMLGRQLQDFLFVFRPDFRRTVGAQIATPQYLAHFGLLFIY